MVVPEVILPLKGGYPSGSIVQICVTTELLNVNH